MKARSIGAAVGAIAGVAVFLALAVAWGKVAARLDLERFGIMAVLADRPTSLACAFSLGATLFAGIALLFALIGGLVETIGVRRRIGALRHDEALIDRWTAADWRAAFAGSSVADQAEAMVVFQPADKGETRRVAVDTPILLALDRLWLDRLTLAGSVAPLPTLTAGFSILLALTAVALGERWDVPLLAGVAAWFAIAFGRYIVCLVLRPAVAAAVGAATAAVRPLSSIRAAEIVRAAEPRLEPLPVPAAAVPEQQPAPAPDSPARLAHEEAEIIAAALSNVIWEPLGRLAEAAEKLTAAAAPKSRDQAITSALAEIRAGIERLLDDREDAQPY